MVKRTPYSLYFHVPFCTRKCDYCHFYVIPDQTRYHTLYLNALKLEWTLRTPLLPKNPPLSIYFGGGTPSLLAPEAIEEILSWILPNDKCEITLEANPEQMSYEKIKDFKAAGVNRLSIGVQSFDQSLLTLLTRTHSTQQSLQTIEAAQKAGVENVSIDLMYDLPQQTLASWHETLTQAIELPITHLSLYNLTIEPHTVFYKKRKNLPLPDDSLSYKMHLLALEKMEEGGFKRYEISAFSRKNQISVHNTGYWTGRPFLGLGPSAFSFWNQSRFRNISNLNRYAKALQEGQDPLDFKESLSAFDLLKESLAIGLRRLEGISLKKWPESILKGIDSLLQAGLLEKDHSHLRLTQKGLLFHDTVAEEIICL